MGALLLNVGLRNDLSRKVQPLAKVVETLGGEGVVVPLPGELGLEVAAGGQGLASLDDLLGRFVRVVSRTLRFAKSSIAETYVEVLGVNLAVLGQVEVLLGDEHTLAEEVLVDRLAVGLGDQPGALSVLVIRMLYIGIEVLLTFWQRVLFG